VLASAPAKHFWLIAYEEPAVKSAATATISAAHLQPLVGLTQVPKTGYRSSSRIDVLQNTPGSFAAPQAGPLCCLDSRGKTCIHYWLATLINSSKSALFLPNAGAVSEAVSVERARREAS